VNFQFSTAGRIVFGSGALQEAGPAAASLGRRALVVTGRQADRAGPLFGALAASGVETESFSVPGEPTVDLVAAAATRAREAGCSMVAGFGGGSALDTAKAVSALLTNDGDLSDYLEVVGAGRPLEKPAAPCIAVPTTAGTGAEVTRNAVIASPRHRAKVSLRHASMLPDLALVDPGLTVSAPPAVTAASGLDALTQLVEPFVSRLPNPLTDALCRQGLARAARALRRAWKDGADLEAREDMCVASLFSGLALANAKLGAAHGIAGPFGGMFPGAPHGSVCARLLPAVMRANIEALAAGGASLERFEEVARLLTGRAQASAADGIGWVEDLCSEMEVAPLARWGFDESDFEALAERAMRASSMQGNPVELGERELLAIFRAAL
jgi:alcohol dehydrogenase class IV